MCTPFLAGALSSIAIPTFCKLLFGCMLSGDGFVTRALLSIGKKGHLLIYQPKKWVSFILFFNTHRKKSCCSNLKYPVLPAVV